MGAIDAFSRTFSIVLANKKLYLFVLIMTLILAPLSVYVIPQDFEYTYNQTSIQRGDVIVVEYGTPIAEDEAEVMVKLLAGLAVYFLVSVLLSSAFQYGTTKGVLQYLKGEDYSLEELLKDGFKHFPGVLAINIVFGLIVAVFIVIAIIPIGVGALIGLPVGWILIFLGVLLFFAVLAFSIGLTSLPVPLYVERKNLGAAFEAFGLVFRNVFSTIGFGVLMTIAVMGIVIIASPLAFIIQLTVPENITPYVSAFVQAPLDALMYLFLWTGGVAFYKELQRMEDIKKVDAELEDLGLEL
ncbi:hypothetical protein [Thermococcus piezophilus]|uniref:Glycerophosphoryl diester phosphodiesterase membrane domain-containing protein n=1 Tax=Thermococcus piezophilus TaxID=1712654 RepID=A0A172WIG5_9EURY|nr:hypothetical protein [Thermococcus piezophilus]ANF23075.1 hypothetical protein A7C91_07780 [Thermococcus piezophilus]